MPQSPAPRTHGVPPGGGSTPPASGSKPVTPPARERPPVPPPPGSDDSASAAPGRPRVPGWARWLILLIALGLWNVLLLAPIGGPGASAAIPYSAFVDQARDGNVASVQFNGQSVTGSFIRPVLLPQQPTASAPPSASTASVAPTGAPAASGSATPISYQTFSTVVPPDGDPGLLPLLEQRGVVVSAVDTSAMGSLLGSVIGLLGTLLPVVLLVGFLLYAGRQAQQQQQGIFGIGKSKARLYNEERPSVTFADVAGEDEAKGELTEVVDFLRKPERYRKLGARLPRGVLLVGPPGTGKTLLARTVAGEARVPFFSITASEFVELFVGVGASRVRDLFTMAKATAPSIIFVDEIDAVGRQRGAGLGGGNDEREQTLNQLLAEMDGFDASTSVIVIAATNRPDVLDPALLRPGRFDRQVTVGYPDRVGREAILKIHTRRIPLAPDVDLAEIARQTPGFAGADLARLANEAALLATRHGRETVALAQFEESLDKVLLGTRQAALTNPQERRVVAYHEGGHALVALLVPGADPVQKVTIVPHGRALGVTQQRPEEDRRNFGRDTLLARLAVSLGGRAAEELVFDQPTTGAESDLKAATDIARRMVGLWGMSDDVGPVSYNVGERDPFLGREIAAPKEYAETTAARIDTAVVELLEGARERARAVLQQHRRVLDALADELVAMETVSGVRLAEIAAAAGDSAVAVTAVAAAPNAATNGATPDQQPDSDASVTVVPEPEPVGSTTA
jgi:cell division protease FtsH